MSSSSDNTIPIVLGQNLPLVHNNSANIQALTNASKGGTYTNTYFMDQNAFSNFYQEIGLGICTVVQSTLEVPDGSGGWKDTDIPVYFAMAGTGANALSIVTYVSVVKSVLKMMAGGKDLQFEGKARIKHAPSIEVASLQELAVNDDTSGPPPVTINGVTYNVAGFITTKFSYSITPGWTATVPLMVLTSLAALPFTKVAFKEFVKPCLQALWQGYVQQWGVMSTAITGEAATTISENAADAATATEEIGEGAEAVTVGVTAAGAAAFGLILVLAAIPIVVAKVLHSSFHQFAIINCTNYDLVWTTPYIYNGTMNIAPAVSNSDQSVNYLIPGFRNLAPPPPPHVAAIPMYGSGGFSFVTDNTTAGLGECLSFQLFDIIPTATDASAYEGATPLTNGVFGFSIPFSGDNYLNCEFSDSAVNTTTYFQQMQSSSSKKKQTSYTVQNTTLGIEMTVTFDYLSGEHPNMQGENQYYYTSVVTLSPIQS